MKHGIAFIAILVILGFVAAIGVGGYTLARNFTTTDAPRQFDFFRKSKSTSGSKSSSSLRSSPKISSSANPSPIISPLPTGGPGPTIYRQPQDKYTITLPTGWKVDKISTTKTYSTTIFDGPSGNISITFGTGKDPIGGCSETTNLQLADRTISACFLLQKDGSQLITRGYTKDKAGLDFTIEAYINSLYNTNRSIILDIIKTIDIE